MLRFCGAANALPLRISPDSQARAVYLSLLRSSELHQLLGLLHYFESKQRRSRDGWKKTGAAAASSASPPPSSIPAQAVDFASSGHGASREATRDARDAWERLMGPAHQYVEHVKQKYRVQEEERFDLLVQR